MSKFVLAISGGVDSMVLLDMIVSGRADVTKLLAVNNSGQLPRFPDDFVVAHFDHGIRGAASAADANFVRQRCHDYGVACTIGHGNLSPTASEAAARQARYRFFDSVMAGASDDGRCQLVTAHHRDDLLETAIINLIRGTGWRGLAPMGSSLPCRPLLNYSKAELVAYAIEHGLPWVEDQTNSSPVYLRNRVRCQIAGWSANQRQQMLSLVMRQRQLRRQIEPAITDYVNCYRSGKSGQAIYPRYNLIMLPSAVAIEMLRRLTGGNLTRPQLEQLLLFVKTAASGKQMNWRGIVVKVDKARVYFSVGTHQQIAS